MVSNNTQHGTFSMYGLDHIAPIPSQGELIDVSSHQKMREEIPFLAILM